MSSSKRRRTTWTKATVPKSPGRPKGARDTVPRSFKASVRALYEIAVAAHPDAILAAIVRELKKGNPRHLQQAADYLDGKPAQEVRLRTVQPITFIFPKDEGSSGQKTAPCPGEEQQDQRTP